MTDKNPAMNRVREEPKGLKLRTTIADVCKKRIRNRL